MDIPQGILDQATRAVEACKQASLSRVEAIAIFTCSG